MAHQPHAYAVSIARDAAERIALLPWSRERSGAIAALRAFADELGDDGEHRQIIHASVASGREKIRALGYTGDACQECGNFTMTRNGACLKCESCGASSGCS